MVKHYLGNYGGYLSVAKKYNIQDSIVRRWVNSYQQFGIEGLKRSRIQAHYFVYFKLGAVKLYETTEMSYREVANSLGMNNPSLICNWRTTILKKCVDGLSNETIFK
ncbi:helix-turn-helix domain-containing protein [Carnobacterium sp. PL12RED10]|uniref:helix-turn-helix domain-containing protein n=1 Tax=Carnobacterium sp. PL12RED10 TaxID=2592351 RepID=UPI0011EBE7DF|nr:helix-turn-helix domain-containing protein [Carnobacterium sp. PL12RED10]